MDNVRVNANLSISDMEKALQYAKENFSTDDLLICDEEGRLQEVTSYIRDSVWAFNPKFITDHMSRETTRNLTSREFDELTKSISYLTEKLCESANNIILTLIFDLDKFVDDAVASDGYGHFLSTWDGKEIEFDVGGNTLYAYRL